MPGQTIEDVKETLDIAFTLGVQHFSAYSLIVEPKTVFYNLMNKGKLRLPGEDHEAKMYEIVMDEMEKHGYNQYEISNFSKGDNKVDIISHTGIMKSIMDLELELIVM